MLETSNANNLLEVVMNIHIPQVERKSELFSYLLAAFAVFTLLMLSLSFIRMAELRLPVPSVDIYQPQTEKTNMPVAIPAPIPPVEQVQSIVTPEAAANTQSILVPQIVPAPAPSVP
jgi:hypothetical protein